MRPRRKPTAKEALRRLEDCERRLLIKQLELEALNSSWAKKFSLAVGIFEAVINDAGTIGEARRWLRDWNARLEAIDPDAPDADERMQELFDEFHIELKPLEVEPEEMIRQEMPS
ncbi:hypothetical protein [Sulfurivirga sp.]|uniref:hypothetical protein n=1 Tax=Sulfurivirga sp. TaxID=2614236 RepID=UPI0025D988A3|nr:hypothetical protein [Sulfurivirga sp.]